MVLKKFVVVLFEYIKGQDFVVCYGGDEFVIILLNIEIILVYNFMVLIKYKFEGMCMLSNVSQGGFVFVMVLFGISGYKDCCIVEDMIIGVDIVFNCVKMIGCNWVCVEGLL